MTNDRRKSASSAGQRGLALFPLALVASSILALAIGAGSVGTRQPAKVAVADPSERHDTARSEEAAAEAQMALALARVAPARSEAELAEAERRAAEESARALAEKKAATEADAKPPQRAAGPLDLTRRDRKSAQQAQQAQPQQTPSAPAVEPRQQLAGEPLPVGPVPPAPVPMREPVPATPREDGLLDRVGGYIPSPSRIAGAVGDGVSKIARFLPGL